MGNVGEFIGGITVLVTLIYLAYQLRQGARSLQRADARASMERFDAFFISMQDPETAGLWLKGLAGELEQPAEQWSFTSLIVRYIYAMQNLWLSSRDGISPKEVWSLQAPAFAQNFTTPGGAANWTLIKPTLIREFVSEVEKHISTGG